MNIHILAYAGSSSDLAADRAAWPTLTLERKMLAWTTDTGLEVSGPDTDVRMYIADAGFELDEEEGLAR